MKKNSPPRPAPSLCFQSDLWAGRTVGLLGGSFNPAHDGHRHISLQALHRLGLDAVWWLVSPQNPLKSTRDMAPLAQRIQSAQKTARHPRIIVTDIETELGTRFTADTLRGLQQRFAKTRFVWLMGADNLHQIHRWQAWENIFDTVPVCVLDRPPRGTSVKSCPAAQRFHAARLPESKASGLKHATAPAWVLLHIPLNPLSATQIRAEKAAKSRKKP